MNTNLPSPAAKCVRRYADIHLRLCGEPLDAFYQAVLRLAIRAAEADAETLLAFEEDDFVHDCSGLIAHFSPCTLALSGNFVPRCGTGKRKAG